MSSTSHVSETVQVDLGERSYSIVIGNSLAELLPEQLAKVNRSQHAVVVIDANVTKLSQPYEQSLKEAGFRITRLVVPSGETSKSIDEASRLWNSMLADRTDRGSIVIAIGGGVVGDLAGFVAASYARGLPLVQIPTTLLSQVDSSVGGKTGINLPNAKNMVGAFWQPQLVLIDTATLEPLPTREFVSGLAEVVKYGVILLPDLFEFLEQQSTRILEKDPLALSHIVAESCRAKASVVQNDERETTGLRAILNYGHTFAHALENVAGYGTLLHGEAVAIGMQMAANLACLMNRVPASFVERQRALLRQLQLPTQFTNVSLDELWVAMQHDKKVEHGKLRFILPTRLGHVGLVADISRDLATRAMQISNQD